MTRADYFMRRQNLMEMSNPKHDGVVFKGVQVIMLGALFGLIGVATLIRIMEPGR